MKLLFLGLSLFLACRQGASQCTSINEIVNTVNVHDFEPPKNLRYEKVADFDFHKFQPKPGEYRSPNDYFIVGLDSKGTCWAVRHFEVAPRLTNFEMYRYDFGRFSVYTFLDTERKEWSYLPALFVVTKSGEMTCLINILPQFGMNSKAGYRIDGIPKISQSSISAIMFLDSAFIPRELWRIHKGELVAISQMNYRENYELESEQVTMYNNAISEVPNSIDMNDCLERFDRHKFLPSLKFEAVPRVPEFNRHMPLWIWAGSHRY